MKKFFLLKDNRNLRHPLMIQETPHEALIETYKKYMYPSHYNISVVDENQIPDRFWERTFIDFDESGHITIDLENAKKLIKSSLRSRRNQKLIELDRDYCSCFDNTELDKMEQIESQKQILRDLPAHIDFDQATSLKDLEALWPADHLGELKKD